MKYSAMIAIMVLSVAAADAASARRTVACIVAALESARTGREVIVDHAA